MTHTVPVCCNCGSTEAEVKQLVRLSNNAPICDACVDDLVQFMGSSKAPSAPALPVVASKTPRNIVTFLDEYVVGQGQAKETLAVAIYNHYKRLRMQESNNVEIDKSNILLLGPTGTGKTLLARTIARMLDVPFVVADATSLTQAGYVGDDVETVLQGLIQAADGDIAKAEKGIVFIDEVDKLAAAKAGPSITRDVGGEGVQQALLKIIEGSQVRVPVSGNRKNPNAPVEHINTKDILFIFAGAFVQLLEEVNKPKETKNAFGFLATEDTKEQSAVEVTPELLSKYGLIPEFAGRMPVIETLTALDVDALERILTEPKNAVVRQMKALLRLDGATLKFENGAIRAIAEQAFKLQTGARGARTILEKLLKKAQFEVPDMPGAIVLVKADLSVDIQPGELKLAA